MRNFTIIPTDKDIDTAELTAMAGAAVFQIVANLKCGEADIIENGRYSFSLRIDCKGFWCIFQRKGKIIPRVLAATDRSTLKM